MGIVCESCVDIWEMIVYTVKSVSRMVLNQMAKDQVPDYQQPPQQIIDDDEDDDDDLLMEEFSNRTRCCAFLPCLESRSSPTRSVLVGYPSLWEKLRQSAEIDDKWWARPLKSLQKVREWSEIIAGPKWKTFIRRFNRSGGKGSSRGSKFSYDALSYSLNFDEGSGRNGHCMEDYGYYPDFSSRYASLPQSCKSSMDLGQNGIPVSA
ncbi:hypothetical protein Cgig2_030582 [Carnegiea gigantea]|uniref:Uncharacterized protein n=1 Tax=Carnegiea gigantea TaxID=171969 RepID=A0A9Q1GXM5_9CARY|nr:hypothetical protein Cgig2_030582 [Carnegiea gigantea]